MLLQCVLTWTEILHRMRQASRLLSRVPPACVSATGEMSMWSDTYCYINQCQSLGQPIGARLFPPEQVNECSNATQRTAPLAPDQTRPDQTRPDQTRPRSAITHHMHRLCEQDAAFRKSIGGMIWPRGASIARLREGAEPVTSDSLLVQTKESDHTFDSTTCGVWCGGDAY